MNWKDLSPEELTKKYQELHEKLGIVSKNWSSRSGYDPTIPFSQIDKISIFTINYKDGRKDITETPRISSNLMMMCQEVLEDWGYKYSFCVEEKILGAEFTFKHDGLHSIRIIHNSVHRDMFKIGGDSGYQTIKDKHTWKVSLEKHIKYLISRSGNIRMERELKLRELID